MLNEERLGRRSDGGAGKGLVEWLALFVEAFDDLTEGDAAAVLQESAASCIF